MTDNLFPLYGDGIHDDTDGIQYRLDHFREVMLPCPKVKYMISRPLELPSNCRLQLPRFAEICLMDHSNCVMLKNKTEADPAERTTSKLFHFFNQYSPSAPVHNIEIIGGIWNFNNKAQSPNPITTGVYAPKGYSGFGMLFYNVKNLRLSSLTLKDPVNFSVTLDTVSYFTIDNILFDFNEGNPYQSNMDGIHVNGNCHHGHIEKLFGTCYDDTVALNAQEGSGGPISHITVSGIYTENAYSAVRLLSASEDCSIKNIHITDIHGTFYHFCIAFMKFYDTGKRGVMENITIDHVYGGKADRALVKFPSVFNYRNFPFIDIQSMLSVKNLTISDVHRCEYINPVPTVSIDANTTVENLTLRNVTSENHTGERELQNFVNKGTIINTEAP